MIIAALFHNEGWTDTLMTTNLVMASFHKIGPMPRPGTFRVMSL